MKKNGKKTSKNVSDILSAERISELMRTKGLRVEIFDDIDSTSTEARREAERGESAPALLVAKAQSAGRGRMGRSIYSPADTGLYMSLLLENCAIADPVRLTTAVSVAVTKAIEEICGVKADIKWVNDIYLNGRKICGILCESASFSDGRKYSVIGVGLNLCTKEFPKDIEDRAASLMPSVNDRNLFAARIADEIMSVCRGNADADIMDIYRKRSLVLGRQITFTENGIEYSGVAEVIDDFGRLCVRLWDGSEKILSSGEISLKLD